MSVITSTLPLTTSTAASTTNRLQHLLPQLFQPDAKPGKRFLKVDILPRLPMLIALEDVQESTWLPAHLVTPIPNVPECILGLMNSRNQVLCVLDLAQLLRLSTPRIQPQHYSIITVRRTPSEAELETSSLLALAVHGIQGIMRLQPEDIHLTADQPTGKLAPFLRGSAVQHGETTPILDVNKLTFAPALIGLDTAQA